ncbi:MAG: YifB family Mg chelatase-like AAA ATPase, partial [Pseudohongiellaceae bacterium]
MALATVYSRALIGVDAPLVTVETHLSNGLPSLSIVGMLETAVRESKERVRCAIINSGLEFPARRITINLAPADLPKIGGRYDLAIALSILAASEQIPAERLQRYEFLGELALGGEIRGIHGVLPAAVQIRQTGRQLILPSSNSHEAALVKDATTFHAGHLLQICSSLINDQALESCRLPDLQTTSQVAEESVSGIIRGQAQAKRALQIAAAGQHNLLMIGPPGTGKTLLANSLVSLLPRLGEQQALELAAVKSVAGHSIDPSSWDMPPFRAPHHTASSIALVGGGGKVKPGEISLAHHGVLFLDELPEFNRQVLEVLREPLESGSITLSRANYRLKFPARFQFLGAMNP